MAVERFSLLPSKKFRSGPDTLPAVDNSEMGLHGMGWTTVWDMAWKRVPKRGTERGLEGHHSA